MKRLFFRTLFFLIPFLYSIYVCSQPVQEKNEGAPCITMDEVSIHIMPETCSSLKTKNSFFETGKTDLFTNRLNTACVWNAACQAFIP